MIAALPLTNPIAMAIKSLYGATKALDAYLDDLLESMKRSANKTIAQAGKVIEAAKYGFGIGYVVSVAVIAIGQMILGNPLTAVATVVTSPVNPAAMTCAAIGAIYYGWNALTDAERSDIVGKLSSSLEVGVELLNAIVAFVIKKAKEVCNSESLAERKYFIADAAHRFGRSLSDVTNSVKDKTLGAIDFVAEKLKREPPEEPRELPRLPI